MTKLETLEPAAREKIDTQKAFGLDDGLGTYLTFSSEPNFELKFESLDLSRSGIELCTVKATPDNRNIATVFVPDGKLEIFLNKIRAYRDEQTTPRREGGPTRPKNQDLVESISDIQMAALESLWTENDMVFPPIEEVRTWEVWLRRSDGIDYLERLRTHASRLELSVGEHSISFIDRKVVLIRGSARTLSRSIDILGMIAELRAPKTTAAFFSDMNAFDQRAWIADLARRMVGPAAGSPYVCLFDTGVNHEHPLLQSAIESRGPACVQAGLGSRRSKWPRHANGGARLVG